ncbi:MAG: alpha/beta hydrolase family protein [Pseudorhodoplanes sp.]|uniref:alpha/beta hydrolase family protein n=1 Tax=Pseudorhodoplanes sp. TaxID=1934341 RepID=UPI003D0E90F7
MTRSHVLSLVITLVSLCTAAETPAQMIEEPWSEGGLHGTIARPGKPARGPAVLIIAGSGPTDRNGNGPPNPDGSKPFLNTDSYRLLAAGLASNGIVSLRYDKRGIAESRALASREDDVVFDHFVTDAITALQSLQSRPGVASVVIAGHSEGGMIALAAAQRVPVAGLVLLTTSGRTYLALLRAQLKGRLPPDLEARSDAIMDSLAAGKRVDDLPPPLAALFRPSAQPFLISIGNFDPAAALAQSKVPALLVHAGRDLQVGQADFDALRNGRKDAQILILPEANHTLKVSPADLDGNRALYSNPSAPLDPALMPRMVEFISSVTP